LSKYLSFFSDRGILSLKPILENCAMDLIPLNPP
jgi:hypothetical protein